MRPDPTRVFLLLTCGCSQRYPLSEVPIVGGTAEGRRIVASELELFSDAVGPDTIELSEIVFEMMDPEDVNVGGRYSDRHGSIQIDVELPIEDVAWVVRHELCHALDHQIDLAEAPQDVLDAYAERLFDPKIGNLPWKDDPRSRRSEAVARICEVGPVVAAAIAKPCPEEFPLLADLGSFAMTEIWMGLPAGPRPEVGDTTMAAFPVRPYISFSLDPTNDPDVLKLVTYHVLKLDTNDPSEIPFTEIDHVNLRTGGRVEAPPGLETGPNVVGEIVLGQALERIVPFRAAGWPDLALVAAVFKIHAFAYGGAEYPQERLLWSGGTGWSAVPLCLPGTWNSDDEDPMLWEVFPGQDQVWYAEGDGQTVWWSPVFDRSP